MTTACCRLVTRLAGAALLLALFACGEDTTPTAVPTPTPPGPTASPTPPPPSLVIQGEQALTAPTGKGGRVLRWDFTTTVPGTVEATISYKYDSSRILVWITDRECNLYQFQRDECFYLAKSLAGERPRVVSATGVKAGTYTLFVSNDGPFDELIGYKVTLLPGSNGDGRLSTSPSVSSAR